MLVRVCCRPGLNNNMREGLAFRPVNWRTTCLLGSWMAAGLPFPGWQPGSGTHLPRMCLLAGVLDEDDAYGIMEDYVTHDDVESYEGEDAFEETGHHRSACRSD